jgi:hypothetical protein
MFTINWGVFWAILAALVVRRVWVDCWTMYGTSIKWIGPEESVRKSVSQMADDVRELRMTLGEMSPNDRAIADRKARASVEKLGSNENPR